MREITGMSSEKMMGMLDKVPFFDELIEIEKRWIVDNHATQFFVATEGEYIITEGTQDTAFFIQLSGTSRVLRSDSQKVLGKVKAGDCFGEIAFLHNTPRTNHIIAESQSILFRVDQEILRAMSPNIREKFKDRIIHKLARVVTLQNQIIVA